MERDVSSLVCDSKKAYSHLSWRADNSSIAQIIEDEVNWIKKINRTGIIRRFKSYL